MDHQSQLAGLEETNGYKIPAVSQFPAGLTADFYFSRLQSVYSKHQVQVSIPRRGNDRFPRVGAWEDMIETMGMSQYPEGATIDFHIF